MKKYTTINYLKTFRERTGMLLFDLAEIIGMHSGNLSKIETSLVTPNIDVIIAYHLILKIPIERLFKNHYKDNIDGMLLRAQGLEKKLLKENNNNNHIKKRMQTLEIITERLKELQEFYVKK